MLYLREQVTDSFQVGEWGTPRSIKAVYEQLSAKAQSYPNPKNATIQKRVFLHRAVRTNPLPADVRLHTLQDLS
jgi:hypothetical protein